MAGSTAHLTSSVGVRRGHSVFGPSTTTAAASPASSSTTSSEHHRRKHHQASSSHCLTLSTSNSYINRHQLYQPTTSSANHQLYQPATTTSIAINFINQQLHQSHYQLYQPTTTTSATTSFINQQQLHQPPTSPATPRAETDHPGHHHTTE